ncbi:multiple sugar transport system permease protein [Kaistia soli DSM 19436]|uniref:Multiple sugar transport system permease protein n=1 Tax=Kaistia soli DSM 19436 TaxID=1122133 RepID=A0A1M4WM74_9HYPH|nr:carbohydrate ABC transporter permease [Kaistia soli]SHE82328.1 multiple sugar transport system permease protein [Kaistia soli DSM 19436]
MADISVATNRRPSRRGRQRRPLEPSPIAYIFYPVLAAAIILPLSWALFGGFKNPNELFTYPPTIWPRSPTLQNFVDIFTRLEFGRYIWNTILVAFFTVLLTLFLGGLAGYALSRWDFQGKEALMIGLLGLQLIPSTVNIVPYYMIMSSLGLLNTLTGLVLIYTATHIPITIWVLKGFFDTVPRALDEAAAIDGCSKWQTFWRVIMPLSLPGLSVAGFLVFVSAWSEFLVPLVIASNKNVAVASVGLFTFFGPEQATSYTSLFAATLITVTPVVIGYLFAQRYIVSGLTAFAEK